MPTTEGYPATALISALASARAMSRRTQRPYHVIDRAGDLEITDTICGSDHVVARDVIAPRRTRDMISAVCAASVEIGKAQPYITRAVELIKAKGVTDAPEAEEVVADLIEEAFLRIRMDDRAPDEPPMHIPCRRPLSFFARMFGRVPHG